MKSNNFKIEIGTIFKDDKRDMIILDREYRVKTYIKKNGKKNNQNQKYYKFKCNKCGYEGWMLESNFNKSIGCGACCLAPKVAVLGINTIWDTDKWMIPIVGEKFAKTHTHSCGDKIYPTCPTCGNIRNKLVAVGNIYTRKRIGCECENSTSYPESIIYSLLSQLNINFKTQLTKSTFEWVDKYRYDFYFELNNEQYICEANGEQHYKENSNFEMSLDDQIENDRLKKELALKNGIKPENYIVIDCRKSTLEWIRENVFISRFSDLFDLNKIDWLKAEKFALQSKIKELCDLWNSGKFENCTDLANEVEMNRNMVREYLKIGNKLKLCNYSIESAKEIAKNRRKKNIIKLVISLIDEKLFKSVKDCSVYYDIDSRRVSDVCNNKKDQYRGHSFKFVKDLTNEEYIKYDIENKLNKLYGKDLI